MGLKEYVKKRDFRRTPEPRGGRVKRAKTLSYVIQKHAATRLHYDFRLELDGVLKSWAVPKGPSLDPADKRLAVEVEDHPIEYGGFEGTIPKGEYGGGSVMLWDRGTWTPKDDPHEGLRKGSLGFVLEGEKLKGAWKLVRMGGRASANADKPQWLLFKERDEWARAGEDAAIVDQFPDSVDTGRSIEEIGGARGKVWNSSPERAGSKLSTRSSADERKLSTRSSADERKRSARSSAADRKRSARSANGKPAARAKAAPTRRVKRAVDVAALPGARRAKLPDWIAPQLATLVGAPPAEDGWLHEIKYDGYRLLCRIDDGNVKLFTRSGQDWTPRFEAIAESAAELPVKQALIDGEAVVLDSAGRSNFQSLQNAIKGGGSAMLFFAFDLLHLDEHDLTHVPLERRKEALADLLGATGANGAVRYSDHVEGQGNAFHWEACRQQLEGIIAKRRDAPYRSGRGRDWLKIKCSDRQEFVIGGYTEPQGAREALGSLLIGVHENGSKLRYTGRVGTGFTAESLRDLHRRLERLEVDTPPFTNPPRLRAVHWVQPRLVAEVEFTETTQDGMLRHPSFKGLREDKPAKQVVREKKVPVESTPKPRVKRASRSARAGDGVAAERPVPPAAAGAIEGVTLTNPDRVLYPELELTKRDLANYMSAIAPSMLSHVIDRPLMLKRCPEGHDKQCFFQKHPGRAELPALGQVRIREKEGEDTYLFVRDAASLVTLVQMGVLEIHLWGSRADDIEQPDRIVFDLDPDPDVEWKRVVETARTLHDLLQGIGLESFLKTTGGKGLHIVVPIRRGPSWDDVKEFSAGIAMMMVHDQPELFTTHMSKARRHGKILLDTVRNRRGSTWIAPYSPRARAGAPISAPVEWEELTARLQPDQFTVSNIARRLAQQKRDPWKGIDAVRQTISATVLRKMIAAARQK